MALPDLTGQNIENTYQRVIQTDGTHFYDGTGSLVNFGGAVFPYTGSAIISGSLIVTGSTEIQYLTASGLNYPDTDGTEFMVLRTDGSGNLSFNYSDRTNIEVRTVEAVTKGDPLRVVGFNNGQNRAEVRRADALNPSLMPSYGLAFETVGANVNTQMVAAGALDNVNTQIAPNDFQEGDILYVQVGGGLTNVKPTGSALIQNVGKVARRQQNSGQILVAAIGRSNDVPNIQPGYAWIGNDNWVATAVPTSSFNEDPFPYTGSAAISGALEVTGDVTIYGTASVNVLITNYESSSIIYASGSTKFGDSLDDTHIFTGSVSVTGSLDVDNTITAVTGSFSHLKGNSPITVQDSITFQSDTITTGSAVISGSLDVKGETSITGSTYIKGAIWAQGTNSIIYLGSQFKALQIKTGGIYLGGTANNGGNNGVSIGNNAGRFATGNNNALVGNEAGYRAAYSNGYVAIGKTSNSGDSAYNKDNSVGVGIGSNYNGSTNTVAIGGYTGNYSSNTPYTSSVFIGHGAGSKGGSNNVYVGYRSRGEGIANTFLGYETGLNSSGSSNVFLGYQAGYNLTGSNQLIIANNSSSALVTGDFENNTFNISGSVSASTYYGDGSNLTGIETDPFPYTGSAVISGSLGVTGSIVTTDNITIPRGKSLIFPTHPTLAGGISIGDNFSTSSPGTNFVRIGNSAGYEANSNKFIAIGDEAGRSSSGQQQIFIGFRAGRGFDNSDNVVVIGHFAAWGDYSNADVDNAVILGTNAGQAVTQTDNVVIIGTNAGYNTEYSSKSVIIGDQAGYNHSGSSGDVKEGNVFIGYQAGYNELGSNKLIIANTGSKALVTGDFANNTFNISGSVSASTYYGDGSNLTGIETDPFPYTGSAVISGSLEVTGSTSLEGNLDLNGNSITAVDNISTSTSNVKLGDISGTTGGANSVYIGSRPMWQKSGNEVVAIGSGVFRHSSSSPGASVGIGSGASSYNRGTNSVVIGKDAFLGNSLSPSTSGNNVVVIGYQAAKATEGVDAVTAIGYQALTSLTTGTGNTAVGYQAGDAITTGINNTIVGYDPTNNNYSYTALIGYQAKSSGNNSISIGWLTNAGVSSTSVGTLAGANGGTGQENVYIGDSSGRFNTGLRNVFVGRSAGYDSSTSSNNVFIGWRAGFSETNSNRLHIDGSNNSTTPLIYGEFDNDLVRINGKLYVSNSLDVTGSVSASTYYGDGSNLTGISSDPFPYTGSAVISGSLTLTGSFNALLPTSSTDTYFVTYNTASYELEARQVATLINPKVEYLDVTASISSGTSITLPNGLSYISSSTYEYLEVFFNGLRLRYDRDFVPTSTTTIQNQIAFPSGSELTFKSLKA